MMQFSNSEVMKIQGIDKHSELDKYVGGFDTVITTSEFEEMR